MRIIKPQYMQKAKIVIYVTETKNKEILIKPIAVEVLKLKAGDRVLFGQDEIDESVFYILKGSKNCGFKTRKHSSSKSFVCNSTEFVELIKSTFKPSHGKFELEMSNKPIDKNGLEAYMLIESTSHE